MTIEELFKTVTVKITADGEHLHVGANRSLDKAKCDECIEYVKANKPQIMEYLRNEEAEAKRAYEEREAKIAAIPGLKEIKDARADMELWRCEFNRSFEGEYAVGGMGVRPKPNYDFDAMYAKYPAAAAYLRADAEANKSNYRLSAIGEKAREAIIDNPENYKAAIKTMDAEIKACAEEHLWD